MSDINLQKIPDRLTIAAGLDIASYGAIIQHWFGFLPSAVSVTATALGGLWCAVQILDTLKRWRGSR
jgi:hypothetical protein